jgi:uncharacterized protein YdaU (DUF1376 family)
MTSEKKTPKHDTWMPLYVNDYFGDTMTFTTEQHGAYLLLLMTAWKEDGRLPNNAVCLAQCARMSPAQWARVEPILRQKFTVTPEWWTHKRVAAELAKAKEHVAKRSAAGKRGAAAKWGLA